ncbi:MAG: hypothetical protein AAB499_01715, partial [Patescibacteria group bacterium]
MAIRLAPSTVAGTFVDILFQRGLLSDLQRRHLSGKNLVEVDRFAHANQVNPDRLAKAYADYYKLPFGSLTNLPIIPSVVRMLPESVARHYQVAPFALAAHELKLAIGDPARLQENAPAILVKLRQQKGLRVSLEIVANNQIIALLDKVYRPPVKISATPSPTPSPLPQLVAHPPGPISPKEPERPVAKQTEKPTLIDLTKVNIAAEILNKIPAAVAKRYQIIVFDFAPGKSKFEPSIIKVAAVRPDDPKVKEVLAFIEQRNKVLLDRYLTTPASFEAALARYGEEDEGVTISETPLPSKPALAPSKPEEKKPAAPAAASKESPLPTTGPTTEPKGPESSSAPANQPSATATKSETASVVSAKDIVNQPSSTGQSPEELERLAKEQQESTEDRNLDRLIRRPVLNADDLAEVYKGGVIPEIVAGTLFLAIRMKASD